MAPSLTFSVTYTPPLFLADQEKMNHDFVKVMHKVSTLGQDMSNLVDCSDVVPATKSLPRFQKSAALPPGKSIDDIETSVSSYLRHLMFYVLTWDCTTQCAGHSLPFS